MAHGVLNLPWDGNCEYKTLIGTKINCSFLPLLSVIFSFLLVIFNSSQTVISMEYIRTWNWTKIRKMLKWIIYFVFTISFRLLAWTILYIYFGEFNIITVILVLLSNFAVFYLLQKEDLKFDPIIGAVLSLSFPTAYTSATHNFDSVDDEIKFNKKIHCYLTIIGNSLLSKY